LHGIGINTGGKTTLSLKSGKGKEIGLVCYLKEKFLCPTEREELGADQEKRKCCSRRRRRLGKKATDTSVLRGKTLWYKGKESNRKQLEKVDTRCGKRSV